MVMMMKSGRLTEVEVTRKQTRQTRQTPLSMDLVQSGLLRSDHTLFPALPHKTGQAVTYLRVRKRKGTLEGRRRGHSHEGSLWHHGAEKYEGREGSDRRDGGMVDICMIVAILFATVGYRYLTNPILTSSLDQ